MIAIEDIAFVRYAAPDLELMERFLVDFGMHRAVRTEAALYMRGYNGAHHVHITERSATAATLGFGLRARGAEDLQKLAAELGTSVEDSPEPGGGRRVRLKDPAGFSVEVIHGQQFAAPIAHREPIAFNSCRGRQRRGRFVRLRTAPAHVVRLGHVFLQSTEFRASVDFYTRLLGFKVSDTYFAGTPDNTIAAFLHCGLGERWTDHHTIGLALAQDGRNRFDHSAYEAIDLDDVIQGGRAPEVPGLSARLGCGAPHPGQPDLRLLARPVRQQGRTLDGRRPRQRRLTRGACRDQPSRAGAVGSAVQSRILRMMKL
jgi:catechol 2,3-dioxygenase-like lactoylglutathione lyase family enzyme